MSVKVELAETTDSFAKLEKLKLKTEAKLKSMPGIDAKVILESPSTLERFEEKAKRVKDLRSK